MRSSQRLGVGRWTPDAIIAELVVKPALVAGQRVNQPSAGHAPLVDTTRPVVNAHKPVKIRKRQVETIGNLPRALVCVSVGNPDLLQPVALPRLVATRRRWPCKPTLGKHILNQLLRYIDHGAGVRELQPGNHQAAKARALGIRDAVDSLGHLGVSFDREEKGRHLLGAVAERRNGYFRALLHTQARDDVFQVLRRDGALRTTTGASNHADRPRPAGYALDVAALLKTDDQAVNAALGFKAHRAAHFVVGRRYARALFLTGVEVTKQFGLFGREHLSPHLVKVWIDEVRARRVGAAKALAATQFHQCLQAALLGVREFPALHRVCGVGPVAHLVTTKTRADRRTANAITTVASAIMLPSACAWARGRRCRGADRGGTGRCGVPRQARARRELASIATRLRD